MGPETSAATSGGPLPSGLLLFPQPYPKLSATVFLTPATPDFNSAQSALLSFDCNSMAALRSPASYNRRSSECSFGTRFAKAAITPCDPATSACKTLKLVNCRFDRTRHLDEILRIERCLQVGKNLIFQLGQQTVRLEVRMRLFGAFRRCHTSTFEVSGQQRQ